VQVFREYYPTNEEFSTLECVWKSDKFVSLERTHKSKTGSQDGDHMEDVPLEASAVKYQSIESFLGGKHFHGFPLLFLPFLLALTPPLLFSFLEILVSGVIACSIRLKLPIPTEQEYPLFIYLYHLHIILFF
jgi:hypothetical protein